MLFASLALFTAGVNTHSEMANSIALVNANILMDNGCAKIPAIMQLNLIPNNILEKTGAHKYLPILVVTL